MKALVQTLRALDEQVAVLDVEIARRAKQDPVARRSVGRTTDGMAHSRRDGTGKTRAFPRVLRARYG